MNPHSCSSACEAIQGHSCSHEAADCKESRREWLAELRHVRPARPVVYVQCKCRYLLGSPLVDSGGRRDTAGASAVFGEGEALFAPLSVSFGMKRAAPAEKPTRILGARARSPKTRQHNKDVIQSPSAPEVQQGGRRNRHLRAASDGPRPFEFCVHLIDAFCLAELEQTKWQRSRRQGVMARLCKQAEYKGLTTNARKSTSL